MQHEELRSWLIERLSAERGVQSEVLDADEPFSAYGLSSVALAEISGELETLLSRTLDPTLLFEHPSVNQLVRYLLPLGESQSRARAGANTGDREPIAIVGMACRFPGAPDLSQYWELLRDGRDAIVEVPKERWDASALYDPEPLEPGRMSTRWGGFISDVYHFDRRSFGIPAAEAQAMDPQQRILLELTWEALSDAGIVPEQLAGRDTGVFIGISQSEYMQLQREDRAAISGYSGTGSALSIAANRISYRLNVHGPSLAIDTACSSSLVALHLAMRSLRAGECSSAVVGGANLLLTPEPTIAFSKAGMMAPDGKCKPFDDAADGYVRGEGVGVVILKRLSQAVADGDPIWAVVRGTATNQDGRSNGLTAPNPSAQEQVLRAAYADAGVDPAQVQYVEAHGTGTRLGDPVEAAALGRVVGAGRAGAEPCWIGSVKGSIGHLEAAAGIASVIKVALALSHERIPASLNFARPNALIPFEALGLSVAAATRALLATPEPAIAGVSSFGFGGSNCHAVLQAHRALPVSAAARVPVVPLSAPDPERLADLARRYADALGKLDPAAASVDDVAFSCARRRSHYPCRTALVGTSIAALVPQLERIARGESYVQTVDAGKQPPRIAFVFSGQGSQWSGMGLEAMRALPSFAACMRACDRWARQHAGVALLDDLERQGPQCRLGETRFAQLAIVALQISLCEQLGALGIRPSAVVGHSVGEISAAVACGAMTREQALALAWQRGNAMEIAAGTGKMLSLPLSERDVEQALAAQAGPLDIAAVNADSSTVVAGPRVDLEALAARFARAGVVTQWVPVDYPFHSRHMQAASEGVRELLKPLRTRAAEVPFVSTVTGDVLPGEHLDADYWAQNVRKPVRFAHALGSLLAFEPAVLVEIGGHPVLKHPLRELVKGSSQPAVRVLSTLHRETAAAQAIAECVAGLYSAGADIEWTDLFPSARQCLRLPPLPWRHERLWLSPAKASVSAPSRAATPVGAKEQHPLLGAAIDLAGAAQSRVYQAHIGTARPDYLADHVVGGTPILPVTAYVELGLQAARLHLGTGASVRSLEVGSALELVDEVELQTWLDLEAGAAAAAVRVYARPAGGSDWKLHASIQLGSLPSSSLHGQQDDDASLAAIQCRCLEQFPVDAFYGALQASGLEYGRAFRPIKEIWRCDGEALATLRLASAAESDPRYVVHPARLDGALQALAAALPGSALDATSELYLPVRISHLWLCDALDAVVKVHAVVRDAEHGMDRIGHIRLLRADGSLAGEIDEIVLRRVGRRLAQIAVSEQAQAIWLYREDWEPLDLGVHLASSTGRVVVLGWGDGVQHVFCAGLARRGHQVVQVVPGERFERLTDARFTLAIDRGADYAALVRELLSTRDTPTDTVVVYLLGLQATDAAKTSGRALQAEVLAGCAPLLRLTRALALNSVVAPPRLWVITAGSQSCHDGDDTSPWQAPLWGLARTVALEHPELRCCRIDLAAHPAVDAGFPEPLFDLMLGYAGAESEFAARAGRVLVPRLVPETAPQAEGDPQIFADATYVVTGGLGALGTFVAGWLAACGARNIALISRRIPDPSFESVVAAMREHGVALRVCTVDVSDEEALERALQELRASMPRIRGIVHAAGVLDDAAVLDVDPVGLDAVLTPKVSGAWNLHRALHDDELDFFVLFSSAAVALGSPGQSSYIAANAFLDALAHARRRAGQTALSIDWGPWSGAGMAVEAATGTGSGKRVSGISMIAPEDGVAMLGALIATPRARAIVLPFDVRSLVHLYPSAAGISRFQRLFGDDMHARRNAAVAPALSRRPALDQPYVAPRTELEGIITSIWQRALEIEAVGINDAFFELGGDSVLAGQVLTHINTSFGIRLDSRAAFENLTVEGLAGLVEAAIRDALDAMSDDEASRLLSESAP